MGEGDEFRPPAEQNKDLPVLEPDRPSGLETRHAEAHELVEENAAVGVVSAFWHELEVLRYHYTACMHDRRR
jgi:hypothetical protein